MKQTLPIGLSDAVMDQPGSVPLLPFSGATCGLLYLDAQNIYLVSLCIAAYSSTGLKPFGETEVDPDSLQSESS